MHSRHNHSSPISLHTSTNRTLFVKILWAFLWLCVIGVVLLTSSGCSLFEYIQRKATQGNINGDNWYVQKIVIDNKETFYAPQVLATNAKQRLAAIDSNSSYDEKSRLKEIAQIDEVATLNFDTQQGRISGQSGCGSYFSSYAWSDREHIELSNGSSTRKLCSPGEIVRFEFRFIRDLEGSFKVIQKSKDHLILEGKEMTIYLYRDLSSPQA